MKYEHFLKTNERGFAEAFLKKHNFFSKSREVGEFAVDAYKMLTFFTSTPFRPKFGFFKTQYFQF